MIGNQGDIKAWHIKWTPIVAKFFDEYCFYCWKPAPKEFGVIHHNDYYDPYPEKESIIIQHCKRASIVWLCRSCHDKIKRRKQKQEPYQTEALGDTIRIAKRMGIKVIR